MKASEARKLSLENTDAKTYLEGINEAISNAAIEGEFAVNIYLPKEQAVIRVVTDDLRGRGYNYSESGSFNDSRVYLKVSW